MSGLLRRVTRFLWTDPPASRGGALGAALRVTRLVWAVARDIISGELTLRAMGLVYVTILSIVPLIAISFSVLKGFGFHRDIEPLLNNLLLPLGDKGQEITAQVIGFVDNVKGDVLAGVGLALLFVTAISMAQRVEDSFNHVWRVERPRNLARRLSEYLSVILVGPVVMVTAMAIIATVRSTTLVRELAEIEPLGTTLLLVGNALPYIMVSLAFTFVYWFVPNARVRFGPALIGGLIGGVLWAGSGALFAAFVAESARTLTIYATFAVVIIALIWLYLCWLTLLVGAQVAFYVQHPGYMRLGYRPAGTGGRQQEQIALTTMLLVARAFRAGGGHPDIDSVAAATGLPGLAVQPVVNRLEQAGLVARTSGDRLLPRRNPAKISLADVVACVRDPRPGDTMPDGSWPAAVADVAGQLERSLEEVLGHTTLQAFAAQAGDGVSAAGDGKTLGED